MSTPLEVLEERNLEESGEVPCGLIFHLSRTGSTALCRGLDCLDSLEVLQELPVINQTLVSSRGLPERTRRLRLLGVVRALGAALDRRFVLKLSSWNALHLEDFLAAFGQIPWVFMYREPVEVLVSLGRKSPGWALDRTRHHLLRIVGPEDGSDPGDGELFARVLSGISGQVLEHAARRPVLFPYQALDAESVAALARRFGCAVDGRDEAAIVRSLRFDSKSPDKNKPFASDSKAKRAVASQEQRALAHRWVRAAFQQLEEKRIMESNTANRASRLEQLFPNLSRTAFLDGHWPNRHLVHHGPAKRLEGLADLEALRGISELLAVAQTSVKVIFDGRQAASTRSYDEIRVEPWQALPLYETGLSVCLSAIDRWVPGVKRWVDQLARELSLPRQFAQCNAYASRRGTGLAKHWDAHEVLVVQLRGSKIWRLAPNDEVPWPTVNYVPAAGFPQGLRSYCPEPLDPELPPDAEAVELKPGSALFLPRGYWHATEATGEDSLSLTFSLAPPTWKDLVLGALGDSLERQSQWREPAAGLLVGGPLDPSADEHFSGLLKSLAGDLTALGLEDLLPNSGEEEQLRLHAGAVIREQPPSGGGPSNLVCIETAPGEVIEVETEPEWREAFLWIGRQSGPFRPDDLTRALPVLEQEAADTILHSLLEAEVIERAG
ncbi:MAG: cupin domain-containing protein [Acidobacteriota bacterium]